MTKTILITGCSSGFGKASVELFAEKGWNVVATMRTPDGRFANTANVLETRLDVEDLASIDAAIAAGISRFGRIDALVNNAGFGAVGIFESIPAETAREQFGVNLFGVLNTIRAMLPHFRSHQSGTIINITSGGGIAGFPLTTLYAATKFAIEGFSESLYWECASQGIAVKIVEPGSVKSTSFGARAGATSTGNLRITDYDAFSARAAAGFRKFASSATATEGDIAKVIYQAATDDSDRLRYVATDDVAQVAHARRETSEEQFMAFMRQMIG